MTHPSRRRFGWPLKKDTSTPGQGVGGWSITWAQVRRSAALSFAGVVFLSSPLMNFESDSPIVHLPIARQLIAVNKALDLDQRWAMFAPPARTVSALGAAFQRLDGWTDVIPLGLEIDLAARARLTAVRGHARLHTFFRAHTFFDRDDGQMPIVRRFYFAALGAYFCEGLGRIPDLQRVRFYHLYRAVPPFDRLPDDPSYTLRPVNTHDLEAQLPIYEYACDE